MSDDFTAAAILLLGSNLTYIFGTVLLGAFFSVTPTQVLQGPFTMNFVGVWWAIGAILGLADVAAVLAAFSSVFSTGMGR